MEKVQVFLDTDVVISALFSEKGASYQIIKNSLIIKIISFTVRKEIKEVSKRLEIKSQKVKKILKDISCQSLKTTKKEILKNYKKFVFDESDSHVVAGIDKTKIKFLLTHNLRHYKTDKIKAELDILVFKPGNFLQYLRSI